ncbi:peptidylprolyl isomerase [Patescibacteria group bacterium]|nr:peptidylprolyl isomerase [Patescibacteria group bacterium]
MVKENKKEELDFSKPKMSKRIVHWVLIVFVIVILAFAGLGVVVYGFISAPSLAKPIAQYIPFPQAIAQGTWVRLSDVSNAVEGLRHFRTYETMITGEEQGEQMSNAKYQQMVLARMIDDALIAKQLEKYSALVSKEEVNDELARVQENLGNDIDLETHVQELYGWTKEDFIKYAVKPALQEKKLKDLYMSNESLGSEHKNDAEIKKRALEVLALAKNGSDFNTLASEHSEDVYTRDLEGDLGTISRGYMPESFDEVAFELQEGEVSDLVRTEYGYHIIYAEEVQENNGEKEIHVRHILFLVDDTFDSWLADQKKAQNVYIFGKDISWNKNESLVEIK